jgi:hypothetical protein
MALESYLPSMPIVCPDKGASYMLKFSHIRLSSRTAGTSYCYIVMSISGVYFHC